MPRTLDRYELLERLGSGSMGEVWKARDTADDSLVALKILPERGATSTGVHRFRREFRAAQGLDHPNIVRVFEFHRGRNLFFTMQYVEGVTLAEQLRTEDEASDSSSRNSPSWIASRLDILNQAALALQHIHAHGILHRDLKPTNVLIGSDGRIRVADFGLARMEEQASEVSAHGLAIGTLAYMAPEQARGGRVDPRSDIYALGAVFYQTLAYRPPFEASDLPALVMRQLYDNPASPRVANPELDPLLESLALRCLAREPLHRPQSATDLLREIATTAERLGIILASTDMASTPPSGLASDLAAPLIGRDPERARLRAGLARAREHGVAAILVAGPAGIGKTRLVEELRVEATLDGFRFTVSRGARGSRPLGAYAPIFTEVARELDKLPRSSRERVLGQDAPALARFVRGITPDTEPRERTPAGSGEAGDATTSRGADERSAIERVRAVWAAENILRRLSQLGPQVIFLDDFHDADHLSVELTEQVVAGNAHESAGTGPLLLIAAARSEALDGGAPLTALRHAETFEEIRLEPLSADDTDQVVCSLLGIAECPRELSALVSSIARGVPRRMESLLRGLRTAGHLRSGAGRVQLDLPDAAAAAALAEPQGATPQRLQQLSEVARRLLRATAALGRGDLETLRRALGLSEDALFDALDELVETRLLLDVPGADELAFPHERVREAVLREAPVEGLTELRLALARHLEAERPFEDSVHTATNLYAAAGSLEDACRLLPESAAAYARAGLLAEAVGRYDEYRVLLGRAGAPPTRQSMRHCGELLEQIGRTEDALDVFHDLIESARRDGDEGELADALCLQGQVQERQGLAERALETYAEAETVARAADDPRRLAAVLDETGLAEANLGRYDRALECHGTALEIARGAGDRAREARALSHLGRVQFHRGNYREALSRFEAALALQEELGDTRQAATTRVNVGHVHLSRGDAAAALASYERALEDKRACGDLRGVASALEAKGVVAAERDENAAAREALAESLAIRRRFRDARAEAAVLVNLGDVALHIGEVDKAEAHFLEAREGFVRIGERMGAVNALLGLGGVAWERYDDLDARRLYEQAQAAARELGLLVEELQATIALARLTSDTGQPGAAADQLRAAEPTAADSGPSQPLAMLRAELLIADARAGREDELAAAADALLASPFVAPRDRAVCLLSCAIALRATGAADRARALEADARRALDETAASLPPPARAGFLGRRLFARLLDSVRTAGSTSEDRERSPVSTAPAAPADERDRLFRRIVLNADLTRPDSLLASFLDVAIEHLHMSHGYAFVAEQGELSVRAARAAGESPANGLEARVPHQLLERALANGLPIASADAARDDTIDYEGTIADVEVHAFVALPVVADGKLNAVAYLHGAARPEPPTAAELETMSQLLSDLAGLYAASHTVQEREERAEALLASGTVATGPILGRSPGVLKLLRLIDSVADSDASVLIEGEDGTGKELVAREIHGKSSRRERPIVAVNCGALAESLLESELFGHVAGAFTGATRDRMGLFEAANGGTLFLDEVGEMSPGLQVKLLRVLENREVTRVGTNSSRPIDVRVVAATNRDLAEGVRTKLFRKDLYYRLKVIGIRVPPLHERRADIPLLAHHFLERFASAAGKPLEGFTQEALHALTTYGWPGNIRELENAVEHAVVLARDERSVRRELLPEELTTEALGAEDAGSLHEAVEQYERAYIQRVLSAHDGNRTHAARALGMSVRNLRKKLARYGIA